MNLIYYHMIYVIVLLVALYQDIEWYYLIVSASYVLIGRSIHIFQ